MGRSCFGYGHFCQIQAPEYYSIFVTVWEVTFETRVRSWIPPSVHTMERGECVETGDQGGGANAFILFSVFGVPFAHEQQPWSTKKVGESVFKMIDLPGENIRFCPSSSMDFIAGIIRRHAITNTMGMLIKIICFGHKCIDHFQFVVFEAKSFLHTLGRKSYLKVQHNPTPLPQEGGGNNNNKTNEILFFSILPHRSFPAFPFVVWIHYFASI